jgi:5'-nucleotidase / UDP-sugar diphosphatase
MRVRARCLRIVISCVLAGYAVAINDFLLTGREIKLDFVTRENPELTVIAEHGDIRKALIAELQR